MKRRIRAAFLRIHKFLLRFGVSVLPVHYYSPVPNLLELERTRDVWAKKSELPGVDMDIEKQARALETICGPYRHEYAGNRIFKEATSLAAGPGFGYIEAQALHAVIRHFKPKKIIEVGSGVSTYCSLAALGMNRKESGGEFSLTCIEPYPSARLKQNEEITLVRSEVQRVHPDFFTRLEENDLLFIDTSHTVKPGGDANFLFLEVLPRLKPGVVVQVHDIYLPYDYQPNLLQTFLFWSETSLLRAYMINNPKIEVLFCLSHLHYEKKEVLKSVFPEYDPQEDSAGLTNYPPFSVVEKHFPCSIYLRTK